MKIVLGADHAGFELKNRLSRQLTDWGHTVFDCGTNSSESSDYPDFAKTVARQVAAHMADRGVLVCGSGIGICMAANRTGGVRAAVLRDALDATMSREHNDANVACFGSRVTDPATATAILETWLATNFAGGRHERRVKKMDAV